MGWVLAVSSSNAGQEIVRPDVESRPFTLTIDPHYRRFLRLEKDRVIEMTWLTAAGTQGVEALIRVELTPRDAGTRLTLTHTGFPDDESRKGHGRCVAGRTRRFGTSPHETLTRLTGNDVGALGTELADNIASASV